MSAKEEELTNLPTPKSVMPTASQVVSGTSIPPIKRIQTYSDQEWEEFIVEWAASLKTHYEDVQRASGPGDAGRDIVAYLDKKGTSDRRWDNYQCKHYDHPLAPADIWTEIGKLCYYVFIKVYTWPHSYFFVAPRYLGPSLAQLMEHPNKLRNDLKKNWNKYCQNKITEKHSVPLTPELEQFVDNADFSIFGAINPLTVIEQHSKTQWYIPRFGGGFQQRPAELPVPAEISELESRYIEQLFEAYSDKENKHLQQYIDLSPYSSLQQHYSRSREHFFRAESIKRFSRDTLPGGVFEELLNDVQDGVIDVADKSHSNGFERMQAVTGEARRLALTSSPLESELGPKERAGVCHHLANEDRLIWVKK